MAYDAKAVANYFLDKAAENKTSLTPMKLQKLIFFAHGWHLGLLGTSLIADQVEAWPFGPVVPSIYHQFKHERNGAITGKATGLDLEKFEIVEPTIREDDVQAKSVMDQIWTAYGKLGAIQLSNLTHLPDTPWAKAREKAGAIARSVPIDDELIRAHFAELAQRNRSARAEGT